MSDGKSPAEIVKVPGLALLIVGILGVCVGVFSLISSVLGIGAAQLEQMQQQGQQLPQWSQYFIGTGVVQIVRCVVHIASGCFVAYAGLQMQQLRKPTLCMLGSIVAMLPCISLCCCFGLPIGIWSLVVLNKPEVRAAFSTTPAS